MFNAKWGRLAVMSAVVLAAAACKRSDDGMGRTSKMDDGMSMAMTAGGAEYTVVFKSLWTPARLPFEYPAAGALTGPHFSGLIGTSHNASYSIFAEGSRPTPGLERLSEEGKHTPLDNEIRAAIASGAAGVLFESDPLRDFQDSLVTTVQVDSAHPLVSVVAMIAPSPDWFTGVTNLNLMENGAWVASRTLEFNAYDSGGDDGTTYKAPDQDNNPKKPTSRAMTRHFAPNGVPLPVATVTFTRK
jgi:hypothetical protein